MNGEKANTKRQKFNVMRSCSQQDPEFKTHAIFVVLSKETAKTCTKMQNARVGRLFFSLNPLFCDDLADVAVVVA